MARESDDRDSKRPIIIIRKNRKHRQEHHGGMWKVAYADFVTAMMAFFLLMWLVNTISNDKLKGVAEFFTPTVGIKGQSGIGLDGGLDPQSKKGLLSPKSSIDLNTGSLKNGPLEDDNEHTGAMTDTSEQKIVNVMNNLEQSLDGNNELSKFSENIHVESTPEGIKIQIMDNINRSIFKPDTAEIEPYMVRFLDVVANLIKTVPNYVSIEGHASPKTDKASDQWSLSVNRADMIRKFFSTRIKPGQIIKLIGKGDAEPYDYKDPNNPKNVRVVILLLNQESVSKFQKSIPD